MSVKYYGDGGRGRQNTKAAAIAAEMQGVTSPPQQHPQPPPVRAAAVQFNPQQDPPPQPVREEVVQPVQPPPQQPPAVTRPGGVRRDEQLGSRMAGNLATI